MRFLGLNILRKCKFKNVPPSVLFRRQCSGANVQPKVEVEEKSPLESGPLVCTVGQWPEEHADLWRQVEQDMRVLPDFVSASEETSLLLELEPVLRRMRYEFDHWDDAIHGFRETERREWREENDVVMCRVKAAAFSQEGGAARPLPTHHVLDLAPAGHIKPHVDAVRFCGDVIAGLCLVSSAVMRFSHVRHQTLAFEALLPRRGLYIMRGVARYDFKHEVPGGTASTFNGTPVKRSRRVAILARSSPRPETDPSRGPVPDPSQNARGGPQADPKELGSGAASALDMPGGPMWGPGAAPSHDLPGGGGPVVTPARDIPQHSDNNPPNPNQPRPMPCPNFQPNVPPLHNPPKT